MKNVNTRSLLIGASISLLVACGGGGGSSDSGNAGSGNGGSGNNGGSNGGSNGGGQPSAELAAQQAALTGIADAVEPILNTSQQAAASLATAITTYCNALGGSGDANATLTAAQDAWKTASNAWQQVEIMNFGPSNEGGLSSPRERIYSWPSVSSCFVDGAVVTYEDDQAGFDINTQSSRRVGLDAAEYLLFSDDLDHTCSSDSSTTGNSGAWNSRANDARTLARCEYAAVVAANVATSIAGVQSTWQTSYRAALTTAGNSGNSTYSSARDAINEVSDALFYLDTEVKDEKLAAALGIGQGNTAGSDKVESRYANNSLPHIKANLEGFKAIINAGFDDLLSAANMGSVATDMIADVDAAITNIDNFTGTLADSISGINSADCTNSTSDSRLEEACAIHADIKKVTDALKTDFVTALNLAIPTSAEGDND